MLPQFLATSVLPTSLHVDFFELGGVWSSVELRQSSFCSYSVNVNYSIFKKIVI